MAKIFRITALISVLGTWNYAGGTESKNVLSATSTSVILGENKSKPETDEFKPSEWFDKIWGTINEQFWDPNFNGVDWQDARKRYRPKALAAENHESFAEIVNRMLAELKTSHTHYFTKWEQNYYTIQAVFVSGSLAVFGTSDTSVVEKNWPGVFSSQANPHRTGIGVVTRQVEDRHYVSAVIASSPAEKAGIVLGDWLVEVNGQPFHPIRSFENRDNEEVELTFQRGSSVSTRRSIKIIPVDSNEREMFESDSSGRTRIIEHNGHKIAYARLWWLNGWAMNNVLKKGMVLRKADGMIINLRDGFGGMLGFEFIAPFLQYGLGDLNIEVTWKNHKLDNEVGFSKPVVVLINGGSRSGKELLAYYIQEERTGASGW